ncbi:hypothetical protein C8F01DRAFT_1167138 [Mycena amicta]|nr:hypothetical protein C8F01DRAFT_1167138 [Mycena amicta]
MNGLDLPRVPPEIQELIINQVDPNDKRTLGACSLVCRTWLALSRPIHFRSIRLDLTFNQSNAHAYAKLFKRRRQTFAAFVKEVVLQRRHSWVCTVLPDLLRHSPAVDSLRLLHFPAFEPEDLHPFSKITRLSLVDSDHWLPRSDSILSFLRQLPLLTHVMVVSWVPPAHIGLTIPLDTFRVLAPGSAASASPLNMESALAASSDFQHLKILEMDMVSPVDIVSRLSVSGASIEALSVVYCGNDGVLYDTIRTAGPALNRLTVILCFPVTYAHEQREAQPTHLAVLRLCSTFTVAGLVSLAIEMLSHGGMYNVRPQELVLEWADDSASEEPVLPWDLDAFRRVGHKLDEMIYNMPDLLRVRILTWKIPEAFKLCLPLCAAAGKLVL